MVSSVVLHEDSFYEYFKPVHQPLAQYDLWGGYGLETFGNDLNLVRLHDPAFVWTVAEGDSGPDMWIIPGIHLVNRICYLITEYPHDWIEAEFRVCGYPSSLTELGLKRQIARLKKMLARPRQNAA